MQKLQTQGVHHITLTGADRQTSIDFWEGVLGMPFVFEQPNLDAPEVNHLYFDPGDGRLITVFTEEGRKPDRTPNPNGIGNLHHLAFAVSRATYTQVAARLKERGIANSGEIDRGFMDSIYFRDPLGQLIELAAYKFVPPAGATHAQVLHEAHKIRLAKGDYNIGDKHLADAIELITERLSGSLSDDRSAKDPYEKEVIEA
jgi:catechol 2,3-dioxygenase-like lactoylglutathione lyase family enzyme